MKKAYTKTVLRCFKANAGRFAAITAIILLGLAFVSGLGTLSPTVKDSFSDSLTKQNVADIVVKSTSASGFSSDELARVGENEFVSDIQPITAAEMKIAEKNTRIYVMPLETMSINVIELEAGRLPRGENEILAERGSDTVEQLEIGDRREILGMSREVVGIAANPLLFTMEGENDLVGGEPLRAVLYLDSRYNALPLPVTDIYVKAEGAKGMNVFSSEYEQAVTRCVDSLTVGGGESVYLTLNENKSYATLSAYCDKIDAICAIFPVFFIAVAALVVLTTMTRLVEEERPVIGCYKTLGYKNGKIMLKYLLFSSVCCLLGAIFGTAAGVLLLPRVIFPAFETLFFLPPLSSAVQLLPGVISAAAMFAAVLGVTAFVTGKSLRGQPAAVLRPKAPKAGKKIFLEHVPFLWKRLSFRYKSTFRNIFRYVNHFIMTVVSVAGSTALVFAGFSLLDVSRSPDLGVGSLAGSFSMIAGVVIAFALLLCAFVIYNLTNMNIGERKREIATLEVLGYHDREVCGYIYREILIMAIIGIAVGIPLGCALIQFVLTYLEFGSLANVQWHSYLLAAGLVILFVGLVDLLLMKKITSVDMTGSLKSIE